MSRAVTVCIASFGTNDPAVLIYDVLWFSDSGKPADGEQELQAGYKCVPDTWDLRQQVLQAEEAAAPCLELSFAVILIWDKTEALLSSIGLSAHTWQAS